MNGNMGDLPWPRPAPRQAYAKETQSSAEPRQAKEKNFAGGIVTGMFKTKLFRYPGPGGWTFAPIPDRHAPRVSEPWGRVSKNL